MHLHKCGGSALMKCIDVNYDKDHVYAIDGTRYRESYDEFQKLDNSKRKRIDLLRGHHFFGSHKYLRKNAVYFTMLREPYSRLASLYNYLRQIDLYKDINSEDMSIAEFLDSGLAMAADNGMTRMLTNMDFDKVPNGNVTRELADEAIANLRSKFIAIGIQEQFNSSLEMFKIKLDWDILPLADVENKTSEKRINSEEVLNFMENQPQYKRFIEADERVYQYALKWFNQVTT